MHFGIDEALLICAVIEQGEELSVGPRVPVELVSVLGRVRVACKVIRSDIPSSRRRHITSLDILI